MFIDLVQNVALLLALGLLYDTVALKPQNENKMLQQVLIGVAIGVIGMAVMLSPWVLTSGIIFDTRSILLSVSGLFIGTVPTLISILMTALLRIYQGGDGIWMGLSVIITSGIIGIAWRHRRQKGLEVITMSELYVFGIIVHLAMLLETFFLPWSVAFDVLSKISLPVIILYPIGTVFLGKLMAGRLIRKKSEEMLKVVNQQLTSSEAKFKSYIENAPDGIFIANEKGRYIEVNKAACKITGYSEAELLESTISKLTQKEYREKTLNHFQSVIKEGFASDNLGFITKSGENRFWSVDAVKLSETCFLGFAKDITERKKTEEKMRFLSAITEKMHESIIVSDLQGQISYINKSAEKLFGYNLDELLGQSPALFNIDPQADKIQNELYETVSKGKVYQGDALNQRKDGSKFICEFTVAPLLNEEGVISSYLSIQRDITEIRNLENVVIKKERLSAIGELASGVAHDFNNALQIIMGGVELALLSEDPDELRDNLISVKHSANDAASRIRQLQRFAKKDQMEKEKKSININSLAEDVIKETKLFMNQYQEKGIHIDVETVLKSQSNIEGNAGELRACLFNLIKNSAEAMPEGGKIIISTRDYDNKVYVRIVDTGIGMDKETQKKIFQPFYSTKGFEQGRGLGMSQVYSIIRDHNGEIYIKESVIGKGTVIEFHLPASTRKVYSEKKEKEYADTANILWVDDEEMIRTLGKRMVEKLGSSADLATSGKEALELLAKGKKYDLIITDIGMPEMNGWQLLEEIRNIDYVAKTAVATGWGADVSEDNKRKYKVDYVLGKPIEIKNLKTLISKVLQSKNNSEELV